MSSVSDGRTIKDWTFDELATYNQANILMQIPKGEFNYAVWAAMDLTLRWKDAQAKSKVAK